MAATSLLARLGLRVATLGSAASLAVAAPIAEGNVSQDAHTRAGRTGFYFPTSESIGVVTNGSERLRLFADGGVQIGGPFTLSPGAGNLQISGTVASGSNGYFNGVIVGLPVSGNTASTVVGSGAGGFNNDTSVGSSALTSASSGGNRTAVGFTALTSVTSGNRNTGVGASVLATLVTGDNNTAVGAFAGFNATGSGNVFLGAYAGFRVTSASNVFAINNVAQASAATEPYYSLLYGTFSGVLSSLTGQTLAVNGTLSVNNSGGAQQAVPTGTVVQVTGASAAVSREMIDSFGTSVHSAFAGRSARGTATAPTALQLNDEITHISAWGRGATAYSSVYRAAVRMFAAEAWTDAAQGTRIGFDTTAPGGVVTTEKVRIFGDGGVQIGGTFTASLGAGALRATGLVQLDAATNYAITQVAVNTSLDATHYTVLVDASGGAITISLPDSTVTSNINGRVYNVKKIDSSVNTVTVQRTGASDQIDGATTSALTAQYQSRSYQCRTASAAANRWSII